MIKTKILEAYETLASAYNNLIDHKPHNAYYDRPNTLRLLDKVEGKRILDAACGPGKYAEILLERGAAVTGVDLSPKMIDEAIKRNGQHGDFFVHDLEKPFETFSDGSFDVILCALAMHYLENWDPTIREFYRLLKPGGALVISIEHPFFDFQYYRSANYFKTEAVSAIWKGFGPRVEVHCYRRPLNECIRPLTENGFLLDRIEEPLPTEDFAKADPRHYRELNKFPAFLMMRALKPK